MTGIIRVGGTILGTTNRGNPFAYPAESGDGPHDYSEQCLRTFGELGLDGLVVIGGDGGADVVLMPEIPFDLARVAQAIARREELGARFSIVVAAEGAVPAGGTAHVLESARGARPERLGGIGAAVATQLARLTGKETRSVVLGHLQRGGTPTSFDRVLASRFGGKAFELIQRREFGVMVANRPPHLVAVPLADIVGQTKRVPLDLDLVRTARTLGISFGD